MHSTLDQRLDHTRRWIQQLRKITRYVAELQRVSVERGGGNQARAHGGQHGFEVVGRGVAAREQRGLTLVELGIGK